MPYAIHVTALPTGSLPLNDPRRDGCTIPDCDELATVRLVNVHPAHGRSRGFTSEPRDCCPTHAGAIVSDAARPDHAGEWCGA